MMGSIFGFDIITAPLVPKMQLSPDVPLTDEFRAEFNAWMREFFGETCLVPEGQAIAIPGRKAFVMHPATARQMRELAAATGLRP